MRGMWGLSLVAPSHGVFTCESTDKSVCATWPLPYLQDADEVRAGVAQTLLSVRVRLGRSGAIIRRDEGDSDSRARRVREAGDGGGSRSRRADGRGGRARARGGAQSSRHLAAARRA